jgi:prepilin-type N-terminal cleavage/methylation domain-containing protein
MSEARQQGFTLIELLVSLAILAIALAVLFGAISGALDRARKGRSAAVGESLVQSLLARAGTERVLAVGEKSGDYSNGFAWRLRVRPYGNADDTKAWHMTAYIVSAIVSWREGELTHARVLTTLRLVPLPSKQP